MTKLELAVDAIKSGNTSKGEQLLREVIQADPQNEKAWLWMSTVLKDADKRKFCLEQALKINPRNQQVARLLAKSTSHENSSADLPPRPNPAGVDAVSPSLEEFKENVGPQTAQEPTPGAAKFWINRDAKIDRVIVVTDKVLIIFNPPDEALDQVEARLSRGEWADKWAKYKPQIIQLNSISGVQANQHFSSFQVNYSQGDKKRFVVIYFENAQIRDLVFEELHAKLGRRFQRSVKHYNLFQAILAPGFWLGVIGVLTYMLYLAAIEIRSGQEAVIQGRYRLFKRLLAWVITIIGPTGVAIVGGLLFIVCLIWFINNALRPPIMNILSPQKEG